MFLMKDIITRSLVGIPKLAAAVPANYDDERGCSPSDRKTERSGPRISCTSSRDTESRTRWLERLCLIQKSNFSYCSPTFEKFQPARVPPQRAYSIFDSSWYVFSVESLILFSPMMPLKAQISHEIYISFTAGSSTTVLILCGSNKHLAENPQCALSRKMEESYRWIFRLFRFWCLNDLNGSWKAEARKLSNELRLHIKHLSIPRGF
jgi:hypothetical protein